MAMIEVEVAIEANNKKGFVRRKNRAGPVKGLDVERATLRSGRCGCDLTRGKLGKCAYTIVEGRNIEIWSIKAGVHESAEK
jgi:hypothetical protein